MKDLGEASGDPTTWIWAFVPAGVACLAGAAIMLAMRPRRRRAQPVEAAAVPLRA